MGDPYRTLKQLLNATLTVRQEHDFIGGQALGWAFECVRPTPTLMQTAYEHCKRHRVDVA